MFSAMFGVMINVRKVMCDAPCLLRWVNVRCVALSALASIIIMLAGATSIAMAAEFKLGNAGSIGQQMFLPVDDAFQFSVLQDNDQLLLRWQMQPGYYLYRQRLAFRQGEQVLEVMLPAGLDKTDEYFGEVQVYYKILELSLIPDRAAGPVEIQYQGCADAGLCYPPRLQVIELH